MSHVQPFRGIRFDLAKTGADPLGLCAPPSDELSPARRAGLKERTPWNFAHLQGDAAIPTARRWLREGVLIQDADPCFYVYRQTFAATVAGVDDRFTRIGIVGLIAPSAVLGAKRFAPASDLETDLPVLVHDVPTSAFRDLAAGSGPAVLRFLDDDSVEHAFHVLNDPETVRSLVEILRNAKAVVVDGRIPSGTDPRMALLVPSDSPGLLLRPVHRICRGLPEGEFIPLVQGLAASHEVETLPYLGADAAEALLDTLPEDVLGFVLREKGADQVQLVQVRADASRKRALDADLLRRELEEEFPQATLISESEGHDAMDILDSDPSAAFAVLTRPVPVRTLFHLASSGKPWDPALAPLHPRPWTGLVSRIANV